MKEQIEKYLRQLAPHQNEREGPQLLRGAVAKIDRLEDAIRLTLDENGHLADGDVCTLIRLKLAIEPL